MNYWGGINEYGMFYYMLYYIFMHIYYIIYAFIIHMNKNEMPILNHEN